MAFCSITKSKEKDSGLMFYFLKQDYVFQRQLAKQLVIV